MARGLWPVFLPSLNVSSWRCAGPSILHFPMGSSTIARCKSAPLSCFLLTPQMNYIIIHPETNSMTLLTHTSRVPLTASSPPSSHSLTSVPPLHPLQSHWLSSGAPGLLGPDDAGAFSRLICPPGLQGKCHLLEFLQCTACTTIPSSLPASPHLQCHTLQRTFSVHTGLLHLR